VSKSVLIGSLAACFLAVGVIAVLTATVIANDGGGRRILRADGSFPESGPGMPMPGPGRRQRFQPGQGLKPRGLERMKECLQRQGATPGAVGPGAFRSCLGVPSLR
jgi:hypothetical protein